MNQSELHSLSRCAGPRIPAPALRLFLFCFVVHACVRARVSPSTYACLLCADREGGSGRGMHGVLTVLVPGQMEDGESERDGGREREGERGRAKERKRGGGGGETRCSTKLLFPCDNLK